MEKLNKENFEQSIKVGKVLVDFNAKWCGPCRMLHKELEELENDRTDIKIYSVDVDENEELAYKFGVMSIPTMLYYEDGNLKDKNIGFINKEQIIEWINK